VLVHDNAAAKLGSTQVFGTRTLKHLYQKLNQHGFKCIGRGNKRFAPAEDFEQ
jgi:glutathione peroxidase-family protein